MVDKQTGLCRVAMNLVRVSQNMVEGMDREKCQQEVYLKRLFDRSRQ
jgi:hypothetical protein